MISSKIVFSIHESHLHKTLKTHKKRREENREVVKKSTKEMLHNHKVLFNSSVNKVNLPVTPPPTRQVPTTQSASVVKQCSSKVLTRRELVNFGLISTTLLDPLWRYPISRAEENSQEKNEEDVTTTNASAAAATTTRECSDGTPVKKAFIDVSIDNNPVGRVVIGLYNDNVPSGAARFSNLVSGVAGISYRRKEFIKIMPNYIQHGGVRSYREEPESLIEEWERQSKCSSGVKNSRGTVSIVVRDPSKPAPKIKLVAKKGKLEIDQEEVGVDPNGTEFVISVKDAPELDASSLIVGRVLEGMDVVENIGQVKTVKENSGSPYFRVAKLIGDKRAIVAERGFNRPYSKVVVTNCGFLD